MTKLYIETLTESGETFGQAISRLEAEVQRLKEELKAEKSLNVRLFNALLTAFEKYTLKEK